MAICILTAGRSLALRKGYSFALVIACIECLFVSFGTILGVFTIVALSRESVKASFERVQTAAPAYRQARQCRNFVHSMPSGAHVTAR